jgi:arginine N-succinyltransferase
MAKMNEPWQQYVIRPARAEDLEGVLRLSAAGGQMLTTLPQDRDFLEKRIKRSIHAFYPEVSEPGNESYTLLLEDIQTGDLHGISGFQAKTGGFQPFYTYERILARNAYEPLGIDQEIERLECRTWHDGPSELGSLYLLPEARGRGVGKLLSFSRLLFMACFPERFEKSVIAEIRGWQDDSGASPFWRKVIEPFFGGDFQKMDAFSGIGEKDFLRALLPQHPIYCNLLPEEVRAVIGRAHREAEPAKQLLLGLGFEETNYVDVFDAGPTIQARIDQLPTSRDQITVHRLQIVSEEDLGSAPAGVLFRKDLNFRAVLVGHEPLPDGTTEVTQEQFNVLGEAGGDYGYFRLPTY